MSDRSTTARFAVTTADVIDQGAGRESVGAAARRTGGQVAELLADEGGEALEGAALCCRQGS